MTQSSFDSDAVRRHLSHSLAYCAHICTPSSRWQVLRAQAMLRARGICEVCGDRVATQVHHVTYERLGNERPNDLLALCSGCHVTITPEYEAAAFAEAKRLERELANEIGYAACNDDYRRAYELLPPGWRITRSAGWVYVWPAGYDI